MSYESPEDPSPQTDPEKVEDATDLRLLDVFQKTGLVEASNEGPYTKHEMILLARLAYWQGVNDRTFHPEEIPRTSSIISNTGRNDKAE